MSRLNQYLYGTVFLTGAGVLILEVAAVRILSPIYGSSLYVFSSVLSVILAALSLGYWYGGRRADQKHSIDDLYQIISVSGTLVMVLLLAAVILLPLIGPVFSVQIGPLVFSFMLFFVPAFLLGIVSPYIIKLQSLENPPEQIGAVVGGTFFWGTVGSILGSIASGFWLIPTLGVQQSIMLVSVVLVVLGIVMPLILGRPFKKEFSFVLIGATAIVGFVIQSVDTLIREQLVYKNDGLYSSIIAADFTYNDRPARIMKRDTNNSSAIYLDSKDELPFTYSQFSFLYNTLVPNAERFLLLGGGAYTIPRTLHERDPELQIDVVEIEPILFEIAKEYFDLQDTSKITNYPMDARVFLRETEETYDVIFADAFGTDTGTPFHLTTVEFYKLVHSKLSDDGIFIMNFIGRPKTLRPSLFGSVSKTLTSIFPNTKVYPILYSELEALQNIMFVSRKGDLPIDTGSATVGYANGTIVSVFDMELPLADFNFENELLLTDDHAPVETLMAKQQ